MATILITDDEVACAECVWHTLNYFMRCEVIYVEDKAEALSKITQIQPDLVITDLISPRMGGLDFIRGVKARDKNLPLIVLSGALDRQNCSMAFRRGASHCFDKPFDVIEFAQTVERELKERGVLL